MRVAPVTVYVRACFIANSKTAFKKNKRNSYEEAAIRSSSMKPTRIELLFIIM